MSNTLIRNARVATTEGEVSNANIGIRDGTIAFIESVAKTTPTAGGDRTQNFHTIDAAGKWVIPGLVDCHTHFGAFLPFEDDLITETKAAAAGGVTTVFHVILEPGPILPRLPYYLDAVSRYATVDIHFWAACMTEEHLHEIPTLRSHGIRGFKFFLSYKGDEMESVGIYGIDYAYLQRGLEQVASCDGVAVVHVENYELLQLHKQRQAGKNDFLSFCRSRPPLCEEIDAYATCRMAQEAGAELYLVHTGTADVIDIVGLFRNRGVKVYIETGPRYLLIDETGHRLAQPELALTTPSYKPATHLDRLWTAVAAGAVDTMATDSAANTLKSKLGDGTIWSIQPSWQEMPTSLATMITHGVAEGRISMPQLASLMSTNPARIFGLDPHKGALAPGADADLVIVDTETTHAVERCPHSACDYTPYAGHELTGWPVLTMLRGKVVMEAGEIVAAPGYGRVVGVT